jgi:hypothetical protein
MGGISGRRKTKLTAMHYAITVRYPSG